METETKKKKKKQLIKKVLIGIGIVGVSCLVIRAFLQGKHSKNEALNIRRVYEPTPKKIEIPLQRPVERTPKKKMYKSDVKEKAMIKKCNQLLKALWKYGNPDNRMNFDNETLFYDFKDFPMPPFITQEA